MEDLSLFRTKLEELINEYPDTSFSKDFSNILKELNKYSAIALPSKNIFSRIFILIQSKLKNNLSSEIIAEKIDDLKVKASKIYAKNIALPQNPIPKCLSRIPKNSEKLFFSLQDKERLDTCLTKNLFTNTYKLYPIPIEKDNMARSYLSQVSQISYEFFSCDSSLDQLFAEHTENIKENIQNIKTDFLNSNFEPYYGDVDFLVERSSYNMECMNKIIHSPTVDKKTKEHTLEYFPSVLEKINRMVNLKENCLSSPFDKSSYEEIERLYLDIREIEEILSKDVEQIWKNFLTDPKDYKEGERFAFLAHSITGEHIPPNQLNKVCATLITNNTMPFPYNNVGYIFPMKMDCIGTMCLEDAGSWVTSKEEFFDHGLPYSWQFAEESGFKNKKVFYEEPKVSKLILPNEMEQFMIKQNEQINGEPLNYDKAAMYSEFYMVNHNNELIPEATFIKCFGNQDYLPSVQKITNHSNAYHLPLLPIDMTIFRKQKGLSILTQKEIAEIIHNGEKYGKTR